ncbi:MAG: nucleotide exchange factor GrpE [Actinomycetes bacterium]|jgi:molecular chaperone GrpE|nr:nucleotide exchange factor GrpE [Actinomycetes bacterium]
MSRKKDANVTSEGAAADSAAAATPEDTADVKAKGRAGAKDEAGRTPHKEATPEVTVEDTTDWKAYAMRAQAEFENTKKRLAAQHAAAVERAGQRVIEGLIPVMDDLEYAIAHARESENEITDGIEAIYTKLGAVFQREGVTVIDPTGQPFDHNTANAVQMVPDADVPDQTVVQTLQKGYAMGAKVLRPAMVVVSTAG